MHADRYTHASTAGNKHPFLLPSTCWQRWYFIVSHKKREVPFSYCTTGKEGQTPTQNQPHTHACWKTINSLWHSSNSQWQVRGALSGLQLEGHQSEIPVCQENNGWQRKWMALCFPFVTTTGVPWSRSLSPQLLSSQSLEDHCGSRQRWWKVFLKREKKPQNYLGGKLTKFMSRSTWTHAFLLLYTLSPLFLLPLHVVISFLCLIFWLSDNLPKHLEHKLNTYGIFIKDIVIKIEMLTLQNSSF